MSMRERLLLLLRTSWLDGWRRADYYRRKRLLMFQGEHCYFANRDFGTEPYLVSVGKNVYIAAHVKFVTHDISVKMLMNRSPNLQLENIKPINIGDNVFVGLGSIIMPGANISSDIIIGAGSVVVGSLEPGYVYAGSPARKIRKLEDHISQLSKNEYLWRNYRVGQDKKEFLVQYFSK